MGYWTEAAASSVKTDWTTPPDLFKELDSIYNFTLDPCASDENHLCDKYYTEKEDGLAQDWSGERCFVNPPYGRTIKQWMKKAYESSLEGALVVCLVPSRTDTAWWHEYVMKGEVRFLRGRLRFGNAASKAPFPSAIVVFYPQEPKNLDE